MRYTEEPVSQILSHLSGKRWNNTGGDTVRPKKTRGSHFGPCLDTQPAVRSLQISSRVGERV